MIGLALFGLGSLLSAYSHSPDQLIFARWAAMGFGGAAVMPQTLSIISNVFEPNERPRAIGLWATAVGLGVAVGPVLGGLLLAHFWWGSVFLINVPVTVAGAIAVAILVPESKNPDPGKIDYLGVLLSVVGLVLVVYGIVQGGDTGSWLGADVLGPLFGGLAVLGLFGWHESRISHPSLDVRLFADHRLSASVGAISLLFFGLGGVYFFTTFYLQNVRGYSALDAGLLTIPFAVGQLLFAPRSAALVRRFGAKAVGAAGMLGMAVALAGYAVLGTSTPIWVLAVLFAVQGAGIGVAIPSATSAVMDVLPRERAGAGSALTNTSRQLGVALGVAVLGSILAQSYRSTTSVPPCPRCRMAAPRPPRARRRSPRPRPSQQHLGAAGRGPDRAGRLGVHRRHAPHHGGRRADRAGRGARGAQVDAGFAAAGARAGDGRGRAQRGGRAAGRRGRIGAMRQAEVLPALAGEPAIARRPGRPRSERAERAILEAALELFGESGVAGVGIEAVAARAGVGKATIYRRWPGKEDLLLDALSLLKSPLPEPHGQSVHEDLVAMLRVMCQDAADPTRMRRYALLLGEGEKYPRILQRYKETVVEPRREVIRSVLCRGIASAELRPDADIEVAVAMLTGAVMSQGKHYPELIPADYPERVADHVLLGLAPR